MMCSFSLNITAIEHSYFYKNCTISKKCALLNAHFSVDYVICPMGVGGADVQKMWPLPTPRVGHHFDSLSDRL